MAKGPDSEMTSTRPTTTVGKIELSEKLEAALIAAIAAERLGPLHRLPNGNRIAPEAVWLIAVRPAAAGRPARVYVTVGGGGDYERIDCASDEAAYACRDELTAVVNAARAGDGPGPGEAS